LCAQMLSHQPGAQLCRAGTACDLVISLRSMIPYVELLYIVLDADEKLWTLSERAKVKESGLGQIAFSVVPCSAGFLPYPSVSVYSCKSIGVEGVDIVPGIQLLSFLRTGGKQIRVLSASHSCSETVESKKGLKHKLGKLFD
uniref:TPP_enzyme_N domain-containing protein n=1 Tax=Angiostrongylus cantonensis TaxID=6313 RepID=A0A0K0CUZ2_ANGCA